MPTVIAVYNLRGCVGRCDANCHRGLTARCTCICGGLNHGAGLAQAVRNNERMVGLAPSYLQRYADSHGLKCESLTVIDRLRANKRTALKIARTKLNPGSPGPLFDGLVGDPRPERRGANQGARGGGSGLIPKPKLRGSICNG